MTLKAINTSVVGAAMRIFTTFIILCNINILPFTQSFDLVSSLMSQTPNLSDKLPLPNLKSLLGSSEAVQKLLQSRGLLPFISAEATPTNPIELNKLLAQLKPKQGRFDPALLDMLSNFEQQQQHNENIPSIFGNSHEQPPIISRRMPTSTEENGIIWSSSSTPKPETSTRKTLPNVRNRFSSKFRNKTASRNNSRVVDENDESQTLTTTESSVAIPPMPFDHITDPNIRNHRLYDWEFETYQNFTHIDQAEDLMADESEPSAVIVKATPSSEEASKYVTSTIIPGGWIPKKGVNNKKRPPEINIMRDQLDHSSGSLLNDVLPGTYVKFPSDSDEPVTTRPREPLRESSTENLVFSHSSSEDRDRDRIRDRYNRFKDRDRSDESGGSNNNLRDDFRPSPQELSPPVFVDPDQDFFTSTIRNPSDENKGISASDEYHKHLPGFRPPSRRHRKKHRGQSNSNKKYYSGEEEEDYHKRDRLERNRDETTSKPNPNLSSSNEVAIVDRDQDPRPYPEDDHKDQPDNDRPSNSYSDKYLHRPENSQEYPYSYRKSDRILNPTLYPDSSRGQEGGQSYSSNFLPQQPAASSDSHFHSSIPYSPASNEQEINRHQGDMEYNNNNDANGYYHHSPNQNYNDYPQNQQQQNQNHLGNSPSDQAYAGGYEHQFSHPFGGVEESASEHYHHSGDSSSWSNTFFILGGLIALSALTAFLLPTLLSTINGRNGKHRNDLSDDDLQGEYVDENTSTATSNTATTGSPTNSDDLTADSDLWTEIKGVYNDVVNIVQGDYGGIVNKLTGNTKDKEAIGPNIVYRDEEEDDEDEEEDDELNDDVYYSNKMNNRHKNNKHKNSLRQRKGNSDDSSVSSTTSASSSSNRDSTTTSERTKKNAKNRMINSSINYIVKNTGFPVETSRGASFIGNDTLASFHLGKSFNNNNNNNVSLTTSTEGFLGEWARVQLIGN